MRQSRLMSLVEAGTKSGNVLLVVLTPKQLATMRRMVAELFAQDDDPVLIED